jgi:hypothetical protein
MLILHENKLGYYDTLCGFSESRESLPREAREANARLVAAAPDLLAACIQARADEKICRKCFDLLGEAIAKATQDAPGTEPEARTGTENGPAR